MVCRRCRTKTVLSVRPCRYGNNTLHFYLDMIGYIVIVPTPYFALTTYDGTFTIKNVPPGTYTLKTWSADGKPTTQSITVTDATTNVDLAVVKKK